MKHTILIVEDDEDIIEILTLYLTSNEFLVVSATNGADALDILKTAKPDLALVDIMMPKMNGYDLITAVRRTNNMPIIILSAKTLDSDKVLGLDIGADAYITKPFNPLEVVAYVKAMLRRYYKLGAKEKEAKEETVLRLGELELDLGQFQLTKNKKKLSLTSIELKIMAILLKEPGRVFTKNQLYEYIGGNYLESDANTMMVHISNIRSKIEDNPSNPKYLKTVRGLGYKIEKKQEVS